VTLAAPPLRLALAGALLAVGLAGCQGSDPYFRNRPDAGPGDGAAGTAPVEAGADDAADVAGPCTTCMLRVQYTCRSDGNDQASFVVDVTNEAPARIALTSLTLRYWYIGDLTKPQALDCDAAKLGCTNLVTSADMSPGPRFVPVMPPRRGILESGATIYKGANMYAEIAFKAGALGLDQFLDTGEIQLRVRNQDNSTFDETDDYSFACSMKGNPVDGTRITAYVDGVLVWGVEPPQ
jgi:hypothetical protein